MKSLFHHSSLLLLLFVSFILRGQESPDLSKNPGNEPIEIVFIYGQNLLEMGADKLRIEMSELGSNNFDHQTLDLPVFTARDGWVHYIMNPGWHGVLVVWEREEGDLQETHAKYMFIHASDESLTLPQTAITDDSGMFAVATRKGVMLRAGEGNGFYFPVSSALGLEEIKGTELKVLEKDEELNQKALEVRFTNAALKGIKIGVDTKAVGYLVD